MITDRYILCNRIPIYRSPDGTYATNALWAKDLDRHFAYLADFGLCCPVLSASEAPEGTVDVTQLSDRNVHPLRLDRGLGSVIANAVPNLRQVARALRGAGIVHSGGAGWAFPVSYYILLLRPFRRFRWVMLIESSFWMLPKDGHHSIRKRLAERMHRRLLQACLRRADARIFTQDWYRKELLGHTDKTLIAPASWIDAAAIRPDAPTTRADGPLRVVYPTRLTPEKGVQTVLDAIIAYEALPDAPALVLDIVGAGPLSETVDTAIAAHAGPRVILSRKPMQPYGAPFFEFLQSYDAVLVANRTEEQPRLIFDAFSQALPCIVSATHGNTSVLEPGVTGQVFQPGDASALAACLASAAATPDQFLTLGHAALTRARAHTHDGMHATREAFLKTTLNLGD